MRLRFFSVRSKALLRCIRDRACRGRRRTLPTIGLESVHRSSRRDPSWAARHNRRYRVARRYRALGIPPRHNRAPRESSRPRWDHRDYHGRFWLSLYSRVAGAHWRLMTPPQHLWFFSQASMQAMVTSLGLEVEHLDHPWKVVPLSLISFQLTRMSGLRVRPETSGRIAEFSEHEAD